jgi:uncharacterized protein DUF6174
MASRRVALYGFLVLGLFAVACHKTAPVPSNAGTRPVIKDTTGAALVVKDTPRVVAIFKDTTPASVLGAEGRTFKLLTPGQREALLATLKKERELWRARKPRDYQFLLRVDCFCPGRRGWLLIEVRGAQPLLAWDNAGKAVTLTDWNTFSIDGLYDNLERSADNHREVRIAFDPQWHFPKLVSKSALPGPDAWSIIELRALRPI